MDTEPKIHSVPINGIRMKMVDSSGPGRVIVFIHGLGWDYRMWDPAFTLYAPHYRVVAGDTRGHGASDAPAGPYSIYQFADDWRGALNVLQVEQACLVGFSQGGMIAMQLAIDEPRRFDCLILSSTTSRSSKQAQTNIEQRIEIMRSGNMYAAAKLAADSIFSKSFASSHPHIVKRFIEGRTAVDPQSLIAVMQAGRGFDVSGDLRSWTKPVLVIAGSVDRLVPCAITEQIASQFPNAEFVTIESAGHMVPIEQPEVYYKLVGDFLQKYYPVAEARAPVTASETRA